jgi:hypothetical protein
MQQIRRPEGKRPLERTRLRWKYRYNIQIKLNKIVGEEVVWIKLRDQGWLL